jgi:hypothetical protein
MPFTESMKLEAKQRSSFRCVVCQQPLVEVHHILPESQGGPSTIDKAAPLCAGCHHVYGGNPDLRKQIREMRDWWWSRCAASSHITVDSGLARKVDELQFAISQGQKRHDEALVEIKGLFLTQLNLAQQQVMASGSLSGVMTAVSSLSSGLPSFTPVQTCQPVSSGGVSIAPETSASKPRTPIAGSP